MTNNKYIIIFYTLVILLNVSCVSKRRCIITPISKDILDVEKWEKNIILKNGKYQDTLIFLDKVEVFTDESVRALANYEDCGHLIEFLYKISSSNEELEISLEKKSEENYILSVSGKCTQKLSLNSQTILQPIELEVDSCKTFSFKRINLKQMSIVSITDNGNFVWQKQ